MSLTSASNSWFQSWTPPSSLYPDNYYNRHNRFIHEPQAADIYSRNYRLQHPRFGQQNNNNKQHHENSVQSSNMANFLPYVLSLSMLNGHNSQIGYSPDSTRTRSSNSQSIEPLERTGPFQTWYYWNQIDFQYSSEAERSKAISNENYIPENNLPLGIEVYKDRLFVSMPKWKNGVPATLAVLPRVPREASPKMVPYPSWDWHTRDDCSGLTSVYRMQADECGRLWVIDSGQIEVTIKPKQVCPPQIFVFDLKTDTLLLRYPIPEDFIKQDSLYSNIKIDIREHQCDDAYAYVTDVWRFGLVVFSLRQMHSWRITDHLFYPDPLAAAYNLHGLEFEWTDGIFGMALGPVNKQTDDRVMFFHPMSSFREFYVKTSVLRNETDWENAKDAFKLVGESRGKSGHASASAMDRNGVLFYNQVTRDSVACWDSRKVYKRKNLGLVAHSNETMIFPNDLKIDNEKRQSVWVITNRLPIYLYTDLNPNDINFRIMSAYTDEAIKNNICNPNIQHPDSYEETLEDADCY